jgi:hypothetical protein
VSARSGELDRERQAVEPRADRPAAHDSHDGGGLMSFRLRLRFAADVVLVLALAAIGVASDAGRRLRIALVSGSAAGGA